MKKYLKVAKSDLTVVLLKRAVGQEKNLVFSRDKSIVLIELKGEKVAQKAHETIAGSELLDKVQAQTLVRSEAFSGVRRDKEDIPPPQSQAKETDEKRIEDYLKKIGVIQGE